MMLEPRVDGKVREVLAEFPTLTDFAYEEPFVVEPCVKPSSRPLSAFAGLCCLIWVVSTDT